LKKPTREPEEMREIIADDLLRILKRGPGTFHVAPMPQDASMRRYYRIGGHALSGPAVLGNSIVLMVLADPNPWSRPEEITTGSVAKASRQAEETDLDYVAVLRHFESIGLPVPKLYRYNIDAGLLYIEDLGDKLLENTLKGMTNKERMPLYEQCIDIMIILHENGAGLQNKNFVGFRRSFDEKLLFYELKHYIEYGIEARKKVKVKRDDLKVMEEHMGRISKELASLPRVLVHRDFQSRNLMLQGDRMRIIDFQDALMGIRQYDMVSLLRDSYVVLSAELIAHLIEYYIESLERRAGKKLDRKSFRRIFDLQTLQRKIKDAGRFDYIALVKKNQKFLRYIPDTLGYIREAFERLPEYKPLQKSLARYTPELDG